MKIKEIRQREGSSDIYVVTFKPNWLEKLFGVKEKQKEYRPTGVQYLVGGQREYMDKNGNSLGNFSSISEAIDKYRRQWT